MIAFLVAAGLLVAGALLFLLPALWAGERAEKALAVALAVALPLAAAGLYLATGTPSSLAPQIAAGATGGSPHAVTPESIQGMVARLAARLRENPEDADGWVMLARSYAAIGRYPDSALAYERAAERLPGDAQLLADFADVAAMAQGKRLQGKPETLIARALAADPNNVKALSLAGTVAFEKDDYGAAKASWQRILSLVAHDSPVARSIRGSIADAERRAQAGTGASAR